jgi:Spy/CpxP family protein refolding chaperone
MNTIIFISKEDKMMQFKLLKRLVLVGIIVMILIVPLVVQAGPFGGRHRGMGKGLMGMETLLELNLTDRQRTELLGIIDKSQDEQEKLRERMREARKGLRTVMQADEFSETAIREAFRKSSSVREEAFVLRAKMMNDTRKVLNDEQRAILAEKRKQRWEKMKARVCGRLKEADE